MSVRKKALKAEREKPILAELKSEESFEILKGQIARRDGRKILDQHIGDHFAFYHGDNVEVIKGMPDDSVGLTVSSPPFASLYTYNSSPRDMGNTSGIEEMIEHFRFLVRDLLRVTKPGRSCCIHLTNIPSFITMGGDGGRDDFRGDAIRLFQSEGWLSAAEVFVDKCPQVRAQRTKDRGLLFKSLATDSSVMAPVMCDYILVFRKPGRNTEAIPAGRSTKYGSGGGWITQDEWIEWAHGVWYHSRPGMKGGYRETDVLNVAKSRETDDERHLCPLALPLIERCVKLWSNPGDVVFDPFGGVGSTPYQAIKLRRYGVGAELKRAYWQTAVNNCRRAESERQSDRSLLDLMGELEPETELEVA